LRQGPRPSAASRFVAAANRAVDPTYGFDVVSEEARELYGADRWTGPIRSFISFYARSLAGALGFRIEPNSARARQATDVRKATRTAEIERIGTPLIASPVVG
jgi:hypothetical protein